MLAISKTLRVRENFYGKMKQESSTEYIIFEKLLGAMIERVGYMSKVYYPKDELCRIADEWETFFQGNLNKPMVYFGSVFCRLDESTFKKRQSSFSRYPPEINAEEIIAIEDAFLGCRAFPGDSYPCTSISLDPSNLSVYMGARIEIDEAVWFFPTADRLEDIPDQMDIECYWYRRVQDLFNAAQTIWADGQVQIEPSIGENLDVLAQLRGTESLLLDIGDVPEQVKEKLKKITAEWQRLYQAEHDKVSVMTKYSTGALGVLSKGKTYRLQSDFGYMISPKTYEEFVLPDIRTLSAYLDDPCYHLDGIPQLVHLPFVLQTEKIRAIEFVQGVGNKPPKEWTAVYNKILDAGKQCLAFISAREALELKEAMGGSLRGFGLYIAEYMSIEDAEALYRKLCI